MRSFTRFFALFLLLILLLTGCGETKTSSAIVAVTSEPILVLTDDTTEAAFDSSILPAWNGDLFTGSSLRFNTDLAVLCAEFSETVYDAPHMRTTLKDLGFDAWETYNYTSDDSLGTYTGANCFTIAHDTLRISGRETTVLVIVCRGTDESGERLGDWLKGTPFDKTRKLEGIPVWTNIYDFYADVMKGLKDYRWKHSEVTNGDSLKVLITGHSLGGAAANLCGAKFDLTLDGDEWWSDRIEQSDVFVYTYAAIKATAEDHLYVEGFENIHNIYNYYDCFLPDGIYGNLNVSSMQSLFGHFEYYRDERFHDEEYGVSAFSGMSIMSYANHDIKENYIPAMRYERDVGGLLHYGCLQNVPVTTKAPTPTKAPDNSPRVPDGTYVAYAFGYAVNTFTFYGDHRVSMSALGIAGDGTYEIVNDEIIIEYYTSLTNTPCVWRASFAMRGNSIFIGGDEMVRQD